MLYLIFLVLYILLGYFSWKWAFDKYVKHWFSKVLCVILIPQFIVIVLVMMLIYYYDLVIFNFKHKIA